MIKASGLTLTLNSSALGDAIRPFTRDDITEYPEALSWTHTLKLHGGSWSGTLVMQGDYHKLQTWFYTWLGADIQETFGGVRTWRGYIHEMVLQDLWGASKIITLEDMYNYVHFKYTDDKDEVQDATPVSNTLSISEWGQKEILLTGDRYLANEATAHATTYLNSHSWPIARAMNFQPSPSKIQNYATLTITCLGYVHTMNWKYVTGADGTTVNISTWIDTIASACDIVSDAFVESNTLQTVQSFDSPIRAWDALQELLSRGDADGDLWRGWLTDDLFFFTEQIATTPTYYWKQGRLLHYNTYDITREGFRIVPAIVRDADLLTDRTVYGITWEDERDILVVEVEANSDGDWQLVSENFDESSIWAAQFDYNVWRRGEKEEEDEKAKGKGVFRFGLYYMEWAKLTPPERAKWKKKWRSLSLRRRIAFKEMRYKWFSSKKAKKKINWKEAMKQPIPWDYT